MFRCHLPPALLAEWPGSFTWHCGNTKVERTPNMSQCTKLTLEKIILPPLLPGFELTIFRSWVQRSNQQAIPKCGYCHKSMVSPCCALWILHQFLYSTPLLLSDAMYNLTTHKPLPVWMTGTAWHAQPSLQFPRQPSTSDWCTHWNHCGHQPEVMKESKWAGTSLPHMMI